MADAQPPAVTAERAYSLVELIDIAERRNQATRIEWEAARQAAIGVGIAQAAFLPAITASAIGGYQHVALPFPTNLVARGYITANSEEEFPQLAITYLLFDFGTRRAALDIAHQVSLGANVDFTLAHQKLILDVARAYFTLDGANALLRSAAQALGDAQTLQSAAEALFSRGLGTVVAVDLARRDTAQRQLNVVQAQSAQHEATYGLLAAMDLPPTASLQIVDMSSRPLPPPAGGTVRGVLDEALRHRADLVAAIARLRASESGIALAQSAFMPKLTISANVQGNIGQINVDDRGYEGVTEPQEGVFLHFDWPLYQGGLLQNQLRQAQSRRDAALDEVAETRNRALREVAVAYDQVDTGLEQYRAAIALQTAAVTAYESARASYAHGVASLNDAVAAQAALAGARADVARSHAQCLIDAAALGFATGALTSAEAVVQKGSAG